MQKVVLFDIDKTLLNPGVIKAEIVRMLAQKAQLPASQVRQVFDQYISSLASKTEFDYRDVITVLEEHTQVTKQDLESLFSNEQMYKLAVFPGVVSILSDLQTQYSLGIFSQGVLEWQQLKLQKSGLQHFFHPEITFIKTNKVEQEFLVTLPNAIIIDDKPEVVLAVEQIPHLTPVLISQPALNQTPRFLEAVQEAKITHITDLADVKQILAEGKGWS